MNQLTNGTPMTKIKLVSGTRGIYSFFCPGCGKYHTINTKDEGYKQPIWGFNGDVDKPTFTPSLAVLSVTNIANEYREMRCHSFIRDGKIQYLSDCDHALAGQTIDMIDE